MENIIKDLLEEKKDNLIFVSKNDEEFIEFVKERDNNSHWEKTAAFDLTISECKNPLYTTTNLYAEFNSHIWEIRNVGLYSLFNKAGISGVAIEKFIVNKKQETLSEILNACLKEMGGEILVKIADDAAAAFHSTRYGVMPLSRIFDEGKKYMESTYPKAIFTNGSYSHNFAKMEWDLIEYANEFVKDFPELASKKIVPGLIIESSDVGDNCVTVIPKVKIDGKWQILNSAIKTKHSCNKEFEQYIDSLNMVGANIHKDLKKLENLAKIEIQHPVACLKRVMRVIGIGKKITENTVYEFETMFNEYATYTALDMYCTIGNVSVSELKQSAIDNCKSRALTVDWGMYDRV